MFRVFRRRIAETDGARGSRSTFRTRNFFVFARCDVFCALRTAGPWWKHIRERKRDHGKRDNEGFFLTSASSFSSSIFLIFPLSDVDVDVDVKTRRPASGPAGLFIFHLRLSAVRLHVFEARRARRASSSRRRVPRPREG